MGKGKVLALRIKHEQELRMLNEAFIEKERVTQFNEYARRLETLNHAHEKAVEAQRSTVPRELFDNYVNENSDRVSSAISTINEKNETLAKSLINRHDADYNGLRELLQGEREARKSLEGSINTWKWIASFLGASGVAGVIILFATGTH